MQTVSPFPTKCPQERIWTGLQTEALLILYRGASEGTTDSLRENSEIEVQGEMLAG